MPQGNPPGPKVQVPLSTTLIIKDIIPYFDFFLNFFIAMSFSYFN